MYPKNMDWYDVLMLLAMLNDQVEGEWTLNERFSSIQGQGEDWLSTLSGGPGSWGQVMHSDYREMDKGKERLQRIKDVLAKFDSMLPPEKVDSRCCDGWYHHEPEVLRVYMHDPSLKYGDVALQCRMCGAKRIMTDRDLNFVDMEGDVTVFASTYVKGPKPNLRRPDEITNDIPEQGRGQETV